MQRWRIITPLALVTVVSIAYFTGGARVPMDNDSTSALAISEKASENNLEQKEGGFGADIDLGNGLILNVSDPEVFKAKDFGALGVDGRPLIMTIKVSNSGSKAADIASFSIIQSAFESDSTLSCFDVFEEASGVAGLPMETIIAPGKSLEFKWAILCPTVAGDTLNLTFSATGEEQVTLKTTVK
jgi:hypothetical protein